MFRYRALEARDYDYRKSWYDFEVKDCPALLWEDAFILTAKECSPTLVFKTIVRGHPTLDYFEGDKVYNKLTKKQMGIIVFNNGFYIQKVGTSFKKEIVLEHIYIVKGDRYSVSKLEEMERTPIEFKYGSTIFSFTDTVIVDGNTLGILVGKNKSLQINLERISELLYCNESSGYKVFNGALTSNYGYVTIDNVSKIDFTKEK